MYRLNGRHEMSQRAVQALSDGLAPATFIAAEIQAAAPGCTGADVERAMQGFAPEEYHHLGPRFRTVDFWRIETVLSELPRLRAVVALRFEQQATLKRIRRERSSHTTIKEGDTRCR